MFMKDAQSHGERYDHAFSPASRWHKQAPAYLECIAIITRPFQP